MKRRATASFGRMASAAVNKLNRTLSAQNTVKFARFGTHGKKIQRAPTRLARTVYKEAPLLNSSVMHLQSRILGFLPQKLVNEDDFLEADLGKYEHLSFAEIFENHQSFKNFYVPGEEGNGQYYLTIIPNRNYSYYDDEVFIKIFK
jgi:hypothetical protein